MFDEARELGASFFARCRFGGGEPDRGEIQHQLLVVRFELERGGKLHVGKCGVLLGNRERAIELVIFQIRAARRVDRIECFASEIQLAETNRSVSQRDPVCRIGRIERDHLFAPRKRFAFPGQLRRFRHDPASGDTFWIELKEMPGDEHRTLIIFLSEEILRLFREMPFPPDAVTAISCERHQRHDNANHEPARPAFAKVSPLQGADVAETIVTSGILHCDEELKPPRAGTNRPRSRSD